jgi:hypothetical protein
MQNYITMQIKVRRSANIGGVVLPTRSAPTA